MSDAQPRETVTRRDLVEGKIEKVTAGTDLIAVADGAIDYTNFGQMIDAAKVLSTAGPVLPPWMQGNVGGVLSILMLSREKGISFFALAQWSYLVENKGVQSVAFVAQYFIAVINARAPIKARLQWEIIGEGDERRCKVWATLKGETEPRVFLSDTLAKLRPGRNDRGQIKGSPLWETKPDLQLYYNAARDFARIYFPDVLAGVYSVDEMQDQGYSVVERARDVTPAPNLRERLRGPVGEGFEHSSISKTIDAALAAASDRKPHAGKKTGEETTVEDQPSSKDSDGVVTTESATSAPAEGRPSNVKSAAGAGDVVEEAADK